MFDLAVKDNVAQLTLCREPVNAMSSDWIQAFNTILDDLENRDDWNILHIRSAQKVFSAGADLKQIQRRLDEPDCGKLFEHATRDFQHLFDRIENLAQVTLAEIGGAALSGGFELTLACDLRIASLDAQMGLPEGRLGLIPGAGGTQRLTSLCGHGTASRIILSCEVVDGRTANDLGMIQWAVPASELANEAAQICRRIARMSPDALQASKQCISAAEDDDRNGFEEEVSATGRLIQSVDTRRRVKAFLEH